MTCQDNCVLTRAALSRVLQDRLAAELAALRRGGDGALPPRPWPDSLDLRHGLGADSLDLMGLAGAVNEFFHLHDTGTEDLLLARRDVGAWVDLAQRACARRGARVTFRSSGSTGAPSRCTHRLDDLILEATEHAARLRPGRIFAAVPSHHIYGFIFTALLPSLAGCPVLHMRETLPAAREFRPGDVIVSFPDHLRYLARSYASLEAIICVSSTAPMPADLARELAERGVRLIEIYGASQTAGIAWRDDAEAPFVLLERWRVAEAPEGQGVLRLVDRAGQRATTEDEVRMQGARAFHLLGRVDGAVQVGGINVYPARVAAVLQAHPLIAHARVELAEGGRLAAWLVPRDKLADPDTVRAAMAQWIAANLTPPEQPRALLVETKKLLFH